MAKKLVLAEKPSVGKDIARVLKCKTSHQGYLEGNDYIVTWALGHLVTLADPEDYDEKYKTWRMDTLPMLPKEMKLVVIKETKKQFHTIKELLFRKDVEKIIIATDAGREGELVARWIIDKAGVKKPMDRLWISSVTDKAIQEGFKNLKPAKAYEHLYKAALCRAEGDWLVGLNITRALTCKYNAQLSAGRVQSAALAMIVSREDEIKSFVPKPYFTISALCKGFKLKWQGENGSSIFEEEKANQIIKKIDGKAAEVIEVKETPKKQYPSPLYDLTELQRDANRLYGYSPKQTLSLIQRLYENHKILTYPRTDSRYLSEDLVPTLKDRLQAVSFGNYAVYAKQIISKGIKAHKGFVDNKKVSDHHAIIPTEERPNLANLSIEERKIYDLVIKRFLSVFFSPLEYIDVKIKALIVNELFIASGKRVSNFGFKELYAKEDEDDEDDLGEEETLPDFSKGDRLKIVRFQLNKEMTKTLPYFNEATLLSAMENPPKYVQMDKQSAKTLGETGGIGTVATRADIIEKLYNMFYIEKEGKDIHPTSKGRQLIQLLPNELRSPLMTAKWEEQLEKISQGKEDPKQFIDAIKAYSKELVDKVQLSADNYVHDNMTGKRCPKCNKHMLEVKGKHGIMYVCQDKSCSHKETVSKYTHTRCPQCHKKLEIRGSGQGATYVCTTCTFRQKVSVFEKTHKQTNDKINKKDIQKYIKKINKENEEPLSNAFAEAFAKLKS